MPSVCPHCSSNPPSAETRNSIVRYGYFQRKSDGKRIQRYLCLACRNHFSSASFDPCYWQKKRHLNTLLAELFVSGISQRRAAFILQVTRNTVIRKFLFLGACAQNYLAQMIAAGPMVTELQFDDLETFEHSKCKPLSVIIAVEKETRRILGFRVAKMPAKGLLAAIARKRYGPREDQRKEQRRKLFQELKPKIHEYALIESDQNPSYPPDVREFFPKAQHKTYKGRRGCVVGQGELKAGGFDPLFRLNHTYAMCRANINRLFRKTWNTTKLAERLGFHLALYAIAHNQVIIHRKAR